MHPSFQDRPVGEGLWSSQLSNVPLSVYIVSLQTPLSCVELTAAGDEEPLQFKESVLMVYLIKGCCL